MANSQGPWNPNDPCFAWKGPCFGGFNPQNRGQTGSRAIYIYIYIIYIYVCVCVLNFQATNLHLKSPTPSPMSFLPKRPRLERSGAKKGRSSQGLGLVRCGTMQRLDHLEGFKKYLHPPKTNMAMENGPVEDVFPIEHGDFPLPC